MKLAMLSDTHCRHQMVDVPDADVFVFAGDMCGCGAHYEVHDFCLWLKELPHKHKVIVAGNHDWHFQRAPAIAKEMIEDAGAVYLSDSGCEIDGVKFYGSPFQPEFCSWAFNLPRGGKGLRERWAAIPDDTDVLITHGPPEGILDLCMDGDRPGCSILRDNVIDRVKPQIHVFGHIHSGYGLCYHDGIRFANATICDEDYQPVNAPILMSVEKAKGDAQ